MNTNIIKNTLIICSTFVMEFINVITGKLSPELIACLILMSIDIITGVFDGIMNRSNKTTTGKINSNAFLKGIIKKVCMLLMIVVGYTIDYVLNTHVVKNIVMYWIIANEGISIIENVGKMGLDFKFLKKYFEQLSQPEEQEEQQDDNTQ